MQNPAAQNSAAEIEFDPDALHKKYLEERDKRLRADGTAQYVEVAGDLSHYADDPYGDPSFARAPLYDEVDIVIVGGGISGILAGARCRQAGVQDIRIIDSASDFGGVWYWNRYPGAACDVEAYIYIPLLEEVGYIPTEKYAKSAEIRSHLQAAAKQFDLYSKACLNTQVTNVHWNEDLCRWIIKTNRGDEIKAHFLCLGSGNLNRAKLPGIAGIEQFKGHTFHTSRWDYAYTGGNAFGNLTGLRDKRVGIIGTGATAVQCIPHLGAWAKQLYVFQRTPSAVDVRANRPTDAAWASSLTPGWQKRRMENFDSLIVGIPQDEDMVGDSWTDIWRNLVVMVKQEDGVDDQAYDAETMTQIADFQKMEQIRQRIDNTITDKQTAESLKPYYNLFCKRPCFHDEYLPTFNLPNVTLVDTKGKGVDRLDETAVIFEGQRYEVDCLIYATGFEVGGTPSRIGNFELKGVDGLTLERKWEDGVRTLHGMHVRGFPNLFIISNLAQAAVTVNVPYSIDTQCEHVASILKFCITNKVKKMEISQAAETRWLDTVKAKSVDRAKFLSECTPGYYNNEGRDISKSLFSNLYGGGPFEYMKILQEWQNTGIAEDMELQFEAS